MTQPDDPANNDALRAACEEFKAIVAPAIYDYQHGITSFNRGSNQLLYMLKTGGITYKIPFDKFITFMEGFYSPESLGSQKIQEGLTLRVEGTASEQRRLKPRYSDIDLTRVLDINIEQNGHDVRTLCEAIKAALKQTNILAKLDHHASIATANSYTPPPRQTPSTVVSLPPPSPSKPPPPPNVEFMLLLAGKDQNFSGISLGERDSLREYKEDLEAGVAIMNKQLPDAEFSGVKNYMRKMAEAMRCQMFDLGGKPFEEMLASDPRAMVQQLDQTFNTVKTKMLAKCLNPTETAMADLSLSLVADKLPTLRNALLGGHALMLRLDEKQRAQRPESPEIK